MARGIDTGDHEGRRVGRERFERHDPDFADEFSDWAVKNHGVTPTSAARDIDRAATTFVDDKINQGYYSDVDRNKAIDSLFNWYHNPNGED